MKNQARVALVTGGGRGLGAAISRRLAADGFAVVVNYQASAETANEVVKGIVEAGGSATALRADITDVAANEALFDSVIDTLGRLDVLVCSAGVGVTSRFTELDEAAYDRLFAITKGTYFAMKNAVNRLEADGRIVTLSSGMTRNWAVTGAAYAGSKAAVEQFTRSLSKEVGSRGITVNAVLPGFVPTDMTSHHPPEKFAAARQLTSFNRLGTPEDIADVVSFLASERARWITGQLLVANGGSTP